MHIISTYYIKEMKALEICLYFHMDLLHLAMVCGCTFTEGKSNCKFFNAVLQIWSVFLVILRDITVLRKVKPADWIINGPLGL
jgi:hypothetical protein